MWNDQIEKVRQHRLRRQAGGGEARRERQHSIGKLTVWERLDILLDEGSFVEIGGGMETDTAASTIGSRATFPGDGVITGWGTIEGRRVCVAAEDFTVIGGTLGVIHARKIAHLQDLALEMKVPIIFLNDSGGARIEEGINSLDGYGDLFTRHVASSGVIPQICAILGPCSGGACYSPALCDFIFVVRDVSHMFLTGPAVVETVSGTRPDMEALGGADMHASTSGVAHALYNDETSCLRGIRRLLSYLPSSSLEMPPQAHVNHDRVSGHDMRVSLESIVPDNPRQTYDMHLVIDNITDTDEPLFEIQKNYAKNVITGFSYIGGRVVGIIADQPLELGGVLDCNASDKIARFVGFCDSFHIPLLTLEDVPAFLPGVDQEQKGIIRHGARIVYAYASAKVPRITVILRKAYGGAYIAMNSRSIGADLVYAWPIAEIAVMGAEGAVNILYKRQLDTASKPEAERRRLLAGYEERFLNPEIAMKKGSVDEVILPQETRETLIKAFDFLALRGRTRQADIKHGNMPL